MTSNIATPEQVQALEHDTAPVVSRATALVVSNQETRDGAMDFVKNIKVAMKKVAELFDPIEEAQKEARRVTIAARAKLDDPLKEAEKTIKAKVVSFDRQIEEERQAMQRKLQAEADERARREREKQEAEARRQRAIEEEARAKAEAARLAAEQASAEDRARLRREAEAEERKAAAAAVKAEAREETAAAVVAAVVTVAPSIQKGTGESSRTRWKARLINKAWLLKAAAGGDQLAASLLTFDEVTANKQATASKDNIIVPGVEFYSVQDFAVSTRGR